MKERLPGTNQIIRSLRSNIKKARHMPGLFKFTNSDCLRLRLFSGRLGLRNGPVRIANLEAGKAADGDILTQLADLLRDQVLDRNRLLLDKRLIQQADFLVELAHLAFDDLLDHRSRL